METLTESQSTETQAETVDPTRRFNLKFGYQDKEKPEIFHREVVISRRPNGADVMKALAESANGLDANTLINLHLIPAAISKFGTLAMPTPITVLLSLNEIDEDELNEQYLLFLVGSQPEQEQEILDNGRVRLAFGIERDGVKYDVVEFGKLLDGYARMKINGEAENQWQFNALKMANEVVKISTFDGSNSLSGSLTLADIEAIDAMDYAVIREAESQWLDSFRGK